VILANSPSAVVVSNFFVGALPLTGTEISVVGVWIAIALLTAGGSVLVVVARRRRNLIPPAG